jgi:hypothetical protein
MKRTVLIAWIASLAASAVAGSAQATMIAGWDFSQYFGDGLLSVDGATFTDTLDANYSDLDPTNNAGAESAAFGTLYLNGQFGSTAVPVGSGTEQILPADLPGSLVSNLNAPLGGAGQPFDSLTILASEGQPFTNTLAMIANAALSIVFEADLTSVAPFGTDWSISFGGKTSSGGSSVGVEFSTDGVAYSPFGAVNLTTTDTLFSVNLGAAGTDRAFVRLSFNPAGNQQPIIDNVAVNATLVPEPTTALLCSLGLIGLAISGRRRGVARA